MSLLIDKPTIMIYLLNAVSKMIIGTFILVIPFCSHGQDTLTTKSFKPFKNGVKYNFTPTVMGFSSAIFGYERVTNPYQSFSINAGYMSIGKSGSKENETYELTSTKSRSGFTIAADYRFYFKSQNKNSAPQGVYVGPYYSYYNFKFSNDIESKTEDGSSVQVDSRVAINNIGLQMGYQFVIKNRFTLDMVLIGPSMGGYNLKMEMDSDVSITDEEVKEKIEAVKDILYAKYPWFETLVDQTNLDVSGRKTHWGFGFRYLVQIGFRF